MPAFGDIRIDIDSMIVSPLNGATEVDVNLIEISCERVRIEEYLNLAGGIWGVSAQLKITNAVVSLVSSPGITTSNADLRDLTGAGGGLYAFTAFATVGSNLSGSQEYSWRFSLDLTYLTQTFGPGSPQTGTFTIGVDSPNEPADYFTFTTEYALNPPAPSGLNAMKTIKRLVCAAANKIWYES